jgi:hypothetical protein
MPPRPPQQADAELPPIPDQRRAAAVALALAAEGEALAAAFTTAALPSLPRKIAINLNDDAEPAWALFNHAGGLLRTAPPGPRPRGTTELRLERLIGLDARFEAVTTAGQKRCEAALRAVLDRADTLTRAEFRTLERVMPLLSGRALEIFDNTVQGAEVYADEHRRLDLRKKDTPALLTHQWLRLQSLGHLALAFTADPEALEAINDDPDLPEPEFEDDIPSVPLSLPRLCLDFGLLGPFVRSLRALGAIESDLLADAITAGMDPPEDFTSALHRLPVEAVAGLAFPGLATPARENLKHAATVAENRLKAGEFGADWFVHLTRGLTAALEGPRATAKSRRAWLRAALEEAPELARALTPPPAVAEDAASEISPVGADTAASGGSATDPSEDAEDAAGDSWEDRAMLALLQRPVDWRVQPELFIDLLTHILPWAMARRPRDLYPTEQLAPALTAPPPTEWLHEHTLLCQAQLRPDPIVRTAPKVGRNEPCPCGSGKKFKKCCGA